MLLNSTSPASPASPASCVPRALPQSIDEPLAAPAAIDWTCARCGTSVPANETICPFCAPVLEIKQNTGWMTLLNWLVLILAMVAIFGVGLYFAPA